MFFIKIFRFIIIIYAHTVFALRLFLNVLSGKKLKVGNFIKREQFQLLTKFYEVETFVRA